MKRNNPTIPKTDPLDVIHRETKGIDKNKYFISLVLLYFSKQNNIHGTKANINISGLNVSRKAIAIGKKFKHVKVKNIVSFLML